MGFIPSDIRAKVIILGLCAIGLAISSVVIVAKRKKMAYEVWVPILIICILCAIGTSFVAVCLAAAFVMATQIIITAQRCSYRKGRTDALCPAFFR